MALGECPKSFFKKNFCVAAIGGTFCLGKIFTKDHELFFEKDKEVSLTLKKLCEFKGLLRALGKNFAFAQRQATEETQLCEISQKESIFVKGKVFGKRIEDKTVFEIEFDPITYINLLFSVRDICLFISYPTELQYNGLLAYHTAEGNTTSEKLIAVRRKNEGKTEMQLFMLEQFLTLNLTLIDFYSDVRKLLEGTNKK